MRVDQWIDQLGDRNPQLLRELKGRFKLRNLLIAGAFSLLSQLVLLIYFQGQLPADPSTAMNNRYCTGASGEPYPWPQCLKDTAGHWIINGQLWWQDVFQLLSIIGILALLVAGTYLLISDLDREQRRGTLNFIRLSPQPTRTVIVGKLLGVPVLLFFAALLAMPLHLWAGVSAGILVERILGFYLGLIAAGIFSYTAALLFGLVSFWLGGFQSWLASGVVLVFLLLGSVKPILNTPGDWLNVFNPASLIPQVAPGVNAQLYGIGPTGLQWFNLSPGQIPGGALIFALMNYGLWTYWIAQALQRCFRNPSATMLSKLQSYVLVGCFEVVLLGFAWQRPAEAAFSSEWRISNFSQLLLINLLLFLVLIAALSPQRQVLQDWVRNRRVPSNVRHRALIQELIWGEQSPALVAIALNLVVVAVILSVWLLSWPPASNPRQAWFSLILNSNLILIYAAIAQLVLFGRAQRRVPWTVGALAAVVLLSPILLLILSVGKVEKIPFLWLSVVYSGLAGLLGKIADTTILWGILAQWGVLALLSVQLVRRLRRSGQPPLAVLLTGRR